MPNYSIGLSGLQVAQRAIELIGTNIANATTPGYHRQEAVVQSVGVNVFDGISTGGAEITDVRRCADRVLELEILQQRSALAHTEQELGILETVENAFGQLNTQDLGVAMNEFFDSLSELGAQPDSLALQEQAVWLGDTLAGKFNDLARMLSTMGEQVRLQIDQAVEQANALAREVGDLNVQVANAVTRGGSGNLLRDRRDEAIAELSDLVGVQVYDSPSMSEGVNVMVWGRNVVDQQRVAEMSFAQDDSGQLKLTVNGSFCSGASEGGTIGAMLSFCNGMLSDLGDGLDMLAAEVIREINAIHVQGVGSAGSFTELTGTRMTVATLADAGVTDGELHVRVVNATTGVPTRHSLTIDPDVDTLQDVSDWLDSLDGLSSSLVDGALHIEAANGYEFDFLPALTGQPYTDAITGTAEATIGGRYTGEANQVFTVTAAGSGETGAADDLSLEIRNGAGELVRVVNAGLGYAAGESIDIGNGMSVTLTSGTLNDGDEFTVQALARSDTSGLLAAAGMNTLFTGSSAATIGVRAEVLGNSRLLAVSAGAAGTDSLNAQAMADVGERNLAALTNHSPKEHFTGLRTDVAQAVVVARARQTSQEGILRQLGTQRDELSGVDVNEEAAKLIVFERMYQALSRAIATQDAAMKFLFDIL